MALLKLKDIGKIYVSEGNIAVGIRGVNLEFDKGEFVAVTGKSGSGKSTLLNVISGIDTYEEGELYINGEPTSHYMQPQWENYRQEHISFIFQDYNILDSFTVLQNVELALMHISDPRSRRKRALELLSRVGLGDRINQKGSQLSGGQKQRTVIARALAKDSRIILADEPTGNLDSKTGEEIIKLLHEVSADKLVIIVTHNFEQVQEYATREIRVYDGAIESDRTVREKKEQTERQNENAAPEENRKSAVADNLKKGITLGAVVFKAKPKLSAFICILLILGIVAMFAVTSFNGDSLTYENSYMFTNIEGRLVVATRSGEAIGEEEVAELASATDARDSLYYDYLLDYSSMNLEYYNGNYDETIFDYYITYEADFGKPSIGRYPTRSGEVLLYLPIYYQPEFGKSQIAIDNVSFSAYALVDTVQLKVCGIKYYYDNTLKPSIRFSREGFTAISDFYHLNIKNNTHSRIVYKEDDDVIKMVAVTLQPSSHVKKGEIAVVGISKENIDTLAVTTTAKTVYDKAYYAGSSSRQYDTVFEPTAITSYSAQQAKEIFGRVDDSVYVNTEDYHVFAEKVYTDSYKQASLFYKSNGEARKAAKKINDDGKYVAVTADTKYEPDPMERIFSILEKVFLFVGWIIQILFFAFVINLCTSRSVLAFKSDMAVMRSMGIPVKIIKIGIYVRMLLSLIPAYLALVGIAFTVYMIPVLNLYFVFLRWWEYALIAVGMLLITLRVTHKQVRKLFGESVKKSLKGGAAV